MARLPSLRFRGDQWVYCAFVALVAVGLVALWGRALYLADRFERHAVTVRATITQTLVHGCAGPRSGRPVLAVTFPTPGGEHATTVTSFCDASGAGGAGVRRTIEIRYDVDDLDRAWVVGDPTLGRQVTWLPAGVLAAAALAVWVAPRRPRRGPAAGEPGSP